MKPKQTSLGKEEILDLAIKIIGVVWFVRSSISLLTVLLQGGSFWLTGGCEQQVVDRIGASVIVLVFSFVLMMQSGFFVNLLYGRGVCDKADKGDDSGQAGN